MSPQFRHSVPRTLRRQRSYAGDRVAVTPRGVPELRSAREYADTWEDGLNVRLLGITDLLLRAHVMAMYPDPSDRRRIILEATEKRVAKFAPYFARRQSLTRLFSRYSDDEMAVILDFLTRSTERLREDVAQLES